MSPQYFPLTPVYLLLILLGPFQSLSHNTLRSFIGKKVILSCNCQDTEIVMCFWYKQELGLKPVRMTSYNKYNSLGHFEDAFKRNLRLTLDNLNHNNNLNITDLQASDAATYFCMSSNLYKLNFLESITLDLQGEDGVYFETLVGDLSAEDSATEQGPVTLDCSVNGGKCEGDHRVHWFKPSEESNAGVFYSNGANGDQCERNRESRTNFCVYSLPIRDENSDWTKCAVASCGRVLFGNKRDVRSGEASTDSTQVYILSAALAFTSVLVVILAFVICVLNRRNHTDSYMVSTSYKSIAKTVKKGDVLYYVALEQMKSGQSRKLRDDTWSECAYFNVQ